MGRRLASILEDLGSNPQNCPKQDSGSSEPCNLRAAEVEVGGCALKLISGLQQLETHLGLKQQKTLVVLRFLLHEFSC